VDIERPDDQARFFACGRLPMLFAHLDLEVVTEVLADTDDEASLGRMLTSWQRALSLIATEAADIGDWKRSEQASLLAAACNALTLYYHLRQNQAAVAERVLDGVERFLDKAARFELMPPRWTMPGSVGLDLREVS
jgi:hypothetical protein